jgi:serine O-acetyltransferase
VRIESVIDLRTWIAEDLARYDRGALETLLKEPQVRWQVRLRVTEYLINRGFPLLGALARWRLQARAVRLGYTIPPNACGPGLKLPHWGTIVISGHARVGRQATIHPGTLIGERMGSPRIGDRVYVGAGAKVYGPIVVADDAYLAPNCVVTRSVSAGSVMLGVPARARRSPAVRSSGSSEHP